MSDRDLVSELKQSILRGLGNRYSRIQNQKRWVAFILIPFVLGGKVARYRRILRKVKETMKD